jgi:hypothetical protein
VRFQLDLPCAALRCASREVLRGVIGSAAKREKRTKRKRDEKELGAAALPPKQVPKTLDTLREYDETIVPAEDDEVAGEEMMDEFASYFRGESAPARLPRQHKTQCKSDFKEVFVSSLSRSPSPLSPVSECDMRADILHAEGSIHPTA